MEWLLIEDAASGMQLIQLLRSQRPSYVVAPIACKPEGDKVSRFAAQASRIEAGDLVLPRSAPWLADFITEIIGFPNARYKDQADALSQLLRHSPRWDDADSVPAGPIIVSIDDWDGGWAEPGDLY